MGNTAADVLIETLQAGASRWSSGCLATGSTASWKPSARGGRQSVFVQVRHEEAAAFMACCPGQ
jgi:thiamine pyrophosphate-dependent acetolactate synthase large subunit-like protein